MATAQPPAAASPLPCPGPRLGGHHLAYLRAVAEGVAPAQAAQRYLGQDPADGAVALRRLHQALVDRVRGLARRLGEPHWRLVGLAIHPGPGQRPPPLDDWAEAQGLDGFAQAEQLALYQQAFPEDRLSRRNQRLRAQQRALLLRLAQAGAERPQPHHRLDDWLPLPLCRALQANGLLLLSDLLDRLRGGGRWWKTIPAIGQVKAQRLAQQMALLMPDALPPDALPDALPTSGTGAVDADRWVVAAHRLAGLRPCQDDRPALPATTTPTPPTTPPAGHGPGAAAPAAAGSPAFALDPALLARRDGQADLVAVQAWIAARAGSTATALSYRREMGRFLLFLDQRQATLSACRVDDCLAYMALLQNVPDGWRSRRSAALGHRQWRPFAGRLGPASQRHAVVVVGACFAWLVSARYLPANPWLLVNRRTGAPASGEAMASRALSVPVWQAIEASMQRLAGQDPAAARMLFLLRFLEATGLRAAELLGARLGDLAPQGGTLLLRVAGKGGKPRTIPLAAQARRALADYLAGRGLDLQALQQQPTLPLLASLQQPGQPLGYRALYGSLKAWFNRAIDGTDLPWPDKVAAARASPHWLRHTCGTRALERGVPLDVVGQLLGHADPRTTARYTRAQLQRVSDALEQAFG